MSPRELLVSDSSAKENSGASSCLESNGFMDVLSPLDSDKVMQELFHQTPIKAIDDHLVEFSEALRSVAKTLRRVAEGKAAAQVEAAEWKRKYELERDRNLREKHRETLPETDSHRSMDSVTNSMHGTNAEQNDKCCGKHGICSHEVLRNGEIDADLSASPNKFLRKASFRLCWGCDGGINGQHKHDVVSFERGNITTAERSSKQISLRWESPPRTVLILTKPNSSSVRILCAHMTKWLKKEMGINIIVEPRVKSELLSESANFNFVETWNDDDEIPLLHTKVDLVVTLGGDGTVLWAASMFKGPVPPVVPFSLGSLGFMTPFQSEHYVDYLSSILKGPFSITLRHRLQCHILRDAAKNELDTEETFLVLNEVTIDRGMSAYLTFLECYCDNSFVTCVQGDGLILSTTSGSTAYSLAAGGSMVHPQVPGILFTPICPHSLSFRPLILPEYVTIRVQVPFNSRGHAWASFDGKDRKQLAPGDALICSMAQWPVPTACQVDSTSDFLHSIHDGLHWNLRKSQSFDGPRDS